MHLADFIQANTARITKEWESFASSRSAAAGAMSPLVLRAHIEEILSAIVADMREPESRAEQIEKGRGQGDEGALDVAGRGHADQRSGLGFGLNEAMSEIRPWSARGARSTPAASGWGSSSSRRS